MTAPTPTPRTAEFVESLKGHGFEDSDIVSELTSHAERLETELQEARAELSTLKAAGPREWLDPVGPDFDKAADEEAQILAVVGNSVVLTRYEPRWGTWYGEEGDYLTDEIKKWMLAPAAPVKGVEG